METTTAKFNLGQLLSTPGAIDARGRNRVDARELLKRHASGDWGTVCTEDRALNDEAVQNGSRLFSAYVLTVTEEKVWVITEAADQNGHRVATTILLPEEY